MFARVSGDAGLIEVSVRPVLVEDPGDPILTGLSAGSVFTEGPVDPVLTEAGPVLAEFLWGASTQPLVIKTSATVMDAVVAAPRRT